MERFGKRKLERSEKILVKFAPVWTAVLILLMFGNVLLCQSAVRRRHLADYTAATGRIYREDEAVSQEITEALLKDAFTTDDILAGERALQKFGYTADGIRFAKKEDIYLYTICDAIFLLLAVLLIIVVFLQRRYLFLAAAGEKERVRAELMRSNLGEERYLESKAKQTQNYLENVSHQIRTPLTNIMLNIGLVYEEQNEAGKEILDECSAHAERINCLIERLLKIGRLEAGKIEFERHEENIKELAERLVFSYRRKNRMITEFEDVSLSVDYDWLYEAFQCLLDNCLEHIGAENHVFFSVKKEERSAVIIIADDGAGFNEEDIPYLFERFYSSGDARASKHFGIGLNLAKLIVEGHYGTITACNRADGGAEFLIRLPQYRLKQKTKIAEEEDTAFLDK